MSLCNGVLYGEDGQGLRKDSFQEIPERDKGGPGQIKNISLTTDRRNKRIILVDPQRKFYDYDPKLGLG